MSDDQNHTNEPELLEQPTMPRRRFLTNSAGLAFGFAGSALVGACGGSSSDADADEDNGDNGDNGNNGNNGPSDADILNFALNLEYLEAEFYSIAAFGERLPQNMTGGKGRRGGVNGGRRVAFATPSVRQYAREIANDEIAHVAFLRQALGSARVARPALDISAMGVFTAAARAAGLVGDGEIFDPYANENNFLLAAYIFEDVGVTAYKGASPLVDNKTFLEAAAGILAAEAYHASLVRTVLYSRGIQTPGLNLHQASVAISDARDSLDGPQDLDQGVVRTADDGSIELAEDGTTPVGNVVPLDGNGIAFSRSAGQVLNVVYLTPQQATAGGFYPNGVNGAINASASSSG